MRSLFLRGGDHFSGGSLWQADQEENEKLKLWASGIVLSLGLESEVVEDEGKSFMPKNNSFKPVLNAKKPYYEENI